MPATLCCRGWVALEIQAAWCSRYRMFRHAAASAQSTQGRAILAVRFHQLLTLTVVLQEGAAQQTESYEVLLLLLPAVADERPPAGLSAATSRMPNKTVRGAHQQSRFRGTHSPPHRTSRRRRPPIDAAMMRLLVVHVHVWIGPLGDLSTHDHKN